MSIIECKKKDCVHRDKTRETCQKKAVSLAFHENLPGFWCKNYQMGKSVHTPEKYLEYKEES